MEEHDRDVLATLNINKAYRGVIGMTANQIIEKWNKNADQYNQWDDLSPDEQIEFAFSLGREMETQTQKNTVDNDNGEREI